MSITVLSGDLSNDSRIGRTLREDLRVFLSYKPDNKDSELDSNNSAMSRLLLYAHEPVFDAGVFLNLPSVLSFEAGLRKHIERTKISPII